jgi:hypothetical protein
MIIYNISANMCQHIPIQTLLHPLTDARHVNLLEACCEASNSVMKARVRTEANEIRHDYVKHTDACPRSLANIPCVEVVRSPFELIEIFGALVRDSPRPKRAIELCATSRAFPSASWIPTLWPYCRIKCHFGYKCADNDCVCEVLLIAHRQFSPT